MFQPPDLAKIIQSIMDAQAKIQRDLAALTVKQAESVKKITSIEDITLPSQKIMASEIMAELPKRFNHFSYGPLSIQMTANQGTRDIPYCRAFTSYQSPYYDLYLDEISVCMPLVPNIDQMGCRWVIDNNSKIVDLNGELLTAKRTSGRIIAPDVQYNPFDSDSLLISFGVTPFDTRWSTPFEEWAKINYVPIIVRSGDNLFIDVFNESATSERFQFLIKGHYELAGGG